VVLLRVNFFKFYFPVGENHKLPFGWHSSAQMRGQHRREGSSSNPPASLPWLPALCLLLLPSAAPAFLPLLSIWSLRLPANKGRQLTSKQQPNAIAIGALAWVRIYICFENGKQAQ